MRATNKTQRGKLERAVDDLVDAAIEHSWKGGGDPADIPHLENELDKAKKALNAALDEVFGEVK